MKPALLLFFGLVFSLQAGEKPEPVMVTKATVSTFYRAFPRLTKHPKQVSEPTSDLCRPATAKEMKDHAGPHFDKKLHLYANPSAKQTVAKNTAVFDAEAVIVKEKLSDDGMVVGIGGMIKRSAGFDPKNGDWEYFYYDKGAGFTIGKLQNCSICHAHAKGTDFVFSLWGMVK